MNAVSANENTKKGGFASNYGFLEELKEKTKKTGLLYLLKNEMQLLCYQ